MPNNPRSNGERINKMLTAWETLAAAKSFGGMTLDQFKTAPRRPRLRANA
jgi:hypothetical protein